MMLRRKLRKGIIRAIISVAILLAISPTVLAAAPHEDPERAKLVFSGISLLRYYTEALDFVLQKEPAAVEARLEKMPFANIPQSLEESANTFATSGMGISYLVVEITEDLDKLRALRQQSRLKEAIELAAQISARLPQAYSELNYLEQAAETTGEELKVSSAPIESDLRRSYDELLERIDRIRKMLALYEELLKSTGLTLEELLKPTGLTLEIEPTIAFVGDNIRFEGVLTSEKEPLAGREVDILLNSSRNVTAMTDAYGRYQGRLQVPYWYIPELEVQALYYPQDKDVGLYLASLSPVTKLEVLFYEAELEVTLEDKAYPGRETTIKGRFDYGQSPPLNQRRVEIYVDDVLVAQVVAQEAFAPKIRMDPATDVGQHVVTVSAAAVDRYAPVVASAVLNVTRATPVLDLSTPKVALIPGSVGLAGRLYSEVGPLSEASIKMGLGKSQVEMVSSADGTFDTKIKVGMGLGIIGAQDLVIQVLPQEPWHTPLNATRRILMVNVINCGLFAAVLVFLGIYLPGRLRRLGAYPRRAERPATAMAGPEPSPTYSQQVTALTVTDDSHETSQKPRDKIFHWYRLVARLIQEITKALLRPQQTLREFARESSKVLGPAAKYFIELTKMVERLLYSQYSATEADAEQSQRLSLNIEEETKLPVTAPPLFARQLRVEGAGAQFEPGELSVAGGLRVFDSGGKVSTTSPWRQLATWLWVLLMLAIAYYVFILLFLLPLLVALLA